MKERKFLLAFNRGVISPIGLARIDLERMAFSCEQQTNFIPRVLGSMMLRPGMKYLDSMPNAAVSGQSGRLLPFQYSADETAVLEFSPGQMRVRQPENGDAIITRTAVSSQTTNGGFDSDITGWTDASDTGGTAAWVTGGYAGLTGDGTDFGILRQTVTVAGADQNVEHFVHVIVEDGPVRFKLGSAAGADDYFAEARLDRGEYSISITPTGDFHIEIANERKFTVLVDSVTVKTTAGEDSVSFSEAWPTQADMDSFRWAQSGDVIYLTQGGDLPVLKLERRGNGRSWGIAQYFPEDGPFRVQNVSGLTLTPSALSGNITLTASEALFRQEHADNRALFRIASQGQNVSKAISSADDWTTAIRVTGSGDARRFGIVITGTFSATVKLQFSFTEDGPWNDTGQTWTSPVNTNYTDGQDDQIIYYRIGVDSGDYTSGTATCELTYSGGSIEGVARVYAFTSSTSVSARVLQDFGSTTASRDWWEGEWSDRRGWPTAVDLHEGRLWFAGIDKIWGSVSDGYESFDDTEEGDSGTISRIIGHGPRRIIHWLLAMGRLIMGTSDNSADIAPGRMDGNNPLAARSNSFDEPLTPFNFNIKPVSSRGIFVDRTKQRIYELFYDIDQQDYRSQDLSIYAPDFNEVGIVRVVVQMKPDIRVHCIRSNGEVGMLVFDRAENVIAWSEVITDGASGAVRDVAVLPGVVEDQVYYLVERTVQLGVSHHVCKWAKESEARGATVNKMADSYAEYSGAATTKPFTNELLHLAGEEVEVWADGADVGPLVVALDGSITLAVAASEVIAGLGYRGRFKSAKLGTLEGIGLMDRKKVHRIGFIAKWLHMAGLKYGHSFDTLLDLPEVQDGVVQDPDTIYEDYHEDNFAFGGDWDTDSRICLEANAPKPVTLMAAIAQMETVE